MVWLTIATAAAPGESPSVKSRPSTRGVPMVSKNRGDTLLKFIDSWVGAWPLTETGSE